MNKRQNKANEADAKSRFTPTAWPPHSLRPLCRRAFRYNRKKILFKIDFLPLILFPPTGNLQRVGTGV